MTKLPLTPRERAVHGLYGLTVADIARRLGLTYSTVVKYRRNIKAKGYVPETPDRTKAMWPQPAPQAVPAPRPTVLLEHRFLVLLGERQTQTVLSLVVTPVGTAWFRSGPQGEALLSLPVDQVHIKKIIQAI